MLIVLTTLLGTLSSMFRSRAALELENLALRHQVGVLQRSAARIGEFRLPDSSRAANRSSLRSFGGRTSAVGHTEFSGGTVLQRTPNPNFAEAKSRQA